METAFIVLISVFTLAVIFIVEKKMYQYPPLNKSIVSFQKTLDDSREQLLVKYGISQERKDAKTELIKMNEQNKSFTYIYSSMGLTAVLVILIFATSNFLTYNMISAFCISAISLFCYGIFRLAESKMVAVIILIGVFVLGLLFNLLFDGLMKISSHSFILLALIIVMLGTYSLGRGNTVIPMKN